MKNHLRSAGFGTVLALLVAGSVTTAMAARPLPLGSSPEIPAAQGEVRLHTTQNGNVEIKLRVAHLAPPGRIEPGAEVFVVWVRGLAEGSQAQNLGALKVDRNLSGKLTAVTSLASFDLFITCEQSQAVTVPARLELLPVHCASR